MDENEQPDQEQPKIIASSAPDASPPENPAPAQAATEQELRATEQKIEQQIDERMTGFERSMVRLTRYGLAVTILTGIIFAGQLYEMISGGTQTDKLVSYAKTQANASSDQADAAQQFSDTAEDINERMSDAVDQLSAAAANAKSSIQATQDAMRLDQRAWVTVEGFKPTTFGTGQHFITTRVFKNTGRTPAVHVRVRAVLGPSKPKESVNWTIADKAQPKTTEVLGPQEELNSLLDGTKGVPKGLSDAGFEDIKAGRTIVYDYGTIFYCDVFGREHWTKFCNRFLPGSGEWELCDDVASNSVGDNQKAECKPN